MGKMSKLNSKLFKGKMMESMRKSTENLSGLLEPGVTTSPTGDPLSAGFQFFQNAINNWSLPDTLKGAFRTNFRQKLGFCPNEGGGGLT